MTIVTTDLIYIGNFGEFETSFGQVGNGDAITIASASTVVGNYDAANGLQILQDVAYDTHNSGTTAYEDHITGQTAGTATYDLGAGTVSSNLDTTFFVDVEFFDGAGNSLGTTSMLVHRLDNGDTFLAPTSASATFFSTPKNIASVSVLAVTNTSTSGETLPNPEIDPGIGVVCFTAGTQIETVSGAARAVEELKVGDLVWTVDKGVQPIAWIGMRSIDRATLKALAGLRPVRIRAGALGPGLPRRDLLVSPQHRILVESPIAERICGQRQVLVAAKHLLAIDGVEIADTVETVQYVHLAFAAHQLVLAEGLQAESFFPGAMAIRALAPVARGELFAIFPDLANNPAEPVLSTARTALGGRKARQLARRIQKNSRLASGPSKPGRPFALGAG